MSTATDGKARDQAQDPLRRIIASCAPGLMMAVAISLFTSLSALVIPLYMMQIFDRVLTSQSLGTLTALTVIAVGALTLSAFLEFLRLRLYHHVGEWLGQRLSVEAIGTVVVQSLRGQNPAQPLRDVQEIRSFVSGNSLTALVELLWSPLFFLVLFLLHPVFGLFAFGSALLLLIIGVVNEAVTRRPLRKALEAHNRALDQVTTALRNGEVIEAMGMTRAVVDRWRVASDNTAQLVDSGAFRSGVTTTVSRMSRLMVQVLVMAAGVILVLYDAISASAIFAASIILARALAPFEHLIDDWRRWASLRTAYQRLKQVLTSVGEARSLMELPRPSGAVEIDRLVFVPPGHGRAVLKGISLRIAAGEAIGVIGPSGAGKSTLARLIVGVFKPNSGSVRLDGHDVYQWNRENFGQYVGYLPQSVSLFEATVRENIARLQDADPMAVVEAARRAQVHDMVGRLPHGYDTEISNADYLLSGGQRQRVGLARALFGNPCLLVLDEPDASLDAAGKTALLTCMAEAKRDGVTVIVVSHDRALLDVLDRVVVIRDGAIESIVTPADAVTILKERMTTAAELPAGPRRPQLGGRPAQARALGGSS